VVSIRVWGLLLRRSGAARRISESRSEYPEGNLEVRSTSGSFLMAACSLFSVRRLNLAALDFATFGFGVSDSSRALFLVIVQS